MDMTPDEILDFWFSEPISKYWFNSNEDIDADIRMRFVALWEQARQGRLEHWTQTADGSLALIIVFDQLPLNMYRGQAKSFATEAMGIETARQAIDKGFDKQIAQDRLMFMYMPFMHSENMQDQDYALQLFRDAGLEENLKFALHHRSIVERFGRFPHRNPILGRASSAAEIAYMNSDEAFTG